MGVAARSVAALSALVLASTLAGPARAAVDPIGGLTRALADGGGVDYTCTQSLLGGVLKTGLPLHIDALQTVTVPAGGTVSALTAATGLAPLVDQLADTVLGTVFTASALMLGLGDDLTVPASIGPDGELSVPSFVLPAGAVPGDRVPITAPATMTFSFLRDVLGSLSCVLDDTGSDVLGTVLVGPATTDTTIHVAKPPPPGGGGGTAPAHGMVLSVRLVDRIVIAGRHARVKVRLREGEGVPAPRRVTVTTAGRVVGRGPLRNGVATVRIAALRPGVHALRVRVAGLVKRLSLRVVR